MMKTCRPALLLAFVLSAVVLLGAAVPGPALGARATSVTKALDFLHAQQLSTGGFADASAADSSSITPWVMLAVVAGQENPTKWQQSGKDPLYDYLQTINLTTAAEANGNVPAYYAKVILAYTAVDKPELIYTAGTPRIDLLARMLAYQDSDGNFSPATSGDRSLWDVTTTTWALLALRAAGQSDGNVSAASDWLVNAQNADGGWPLQSGGASAVDSTAAAVQALRVAGVSVDSAAVGNGLAYLHAAQRSDGGFPYAPSDVRSNAESTASVMQALVKAGIDQASWDKNGHTPAEYLRSLQRASGVFEHRAGSVATNSVLTTTQATIALAGKAIPFSLGGKIYAPRHLPSFSSFKPSNGAVFSSTNDVAVEAAYSDPTGGTGINADAVRIFVDGSNKTDKAKIGSAKLTLKLVDLTYGQHTIEIRIADRAGNRRTSKHTITVSYNPSSGGTPSDPGVIYPPTNPGSKPGPRTTLYPTPTATPTTAPTPYPTDDGSVTGTVLTPVPSPSPSASASPTGAASGASGGDEGGSAAALGGTLLLMLPLGAGLSYWLHRRHAASLSVAGQGKILAGGGTPWQRFKGRLPGVS
jgi:hypothetical protein